MARLSEFELIGAFFATGPVQRGDVLVGVGDDAAVLQVPAGQHLVVTIDTLVEGVHFPKATAPRDIGHKALAVNLSDLAAMGATPAWATLALTLPHNDSDWLREFAAGFFALASEHGVALVGGDTTRGHLTITVQAHGFVPPGTVLRRDGARPGDLIYVSGTLGDAGAGLRVAQGEVMAAGTESSDYLLARLNVPQPRIALGLALRELATSAIDVSDGLSADLGHILERSGVGAEVRLTQLPLSPALRELAPGLLVCGTGSGRGWPSLYDWALAAGDDYELCFTVPPAQGESVAAIAGRLALPLTCIGTITEELGLRLVLDDGRRIAAAPRGYRHF